MAGRPVGVNVDVSGGCFNQVCLDGCRIRDGIVRIARGVLRCPHEPHPYLSVRTRGTGARCRIASTDSSDGAIARAGRHDRLSNRHDARSHREVAGYVWEDRRRRERRGGWGAVGGEADRTDWRRIKRHIFGRCSRHDLPNGDSLSNQNAAADIPIAAHFPVVGTGERRQQDKQKAGSEKSFHGKSFQETGTGGLSLESSVDRCSQPPVSIDWHGM